MSRRKKWGNEWNAEYVQRKLASLKVELPAPVADPVDSYEKAAAVLEYFDPNVLRPTLGERMTDKRQLLANSTIVYDQNGQPRAMLRSDRRRLALEQMQLDGIRQALECNPHPDSTVQRVFDAIVAGQAPDLKRQSLSELAATLQTIEWLKGILPDLPDSLAVKQRVERETLLQPFRELAGHAFAGRSDELSRLRKYVAYLPAASLFEAVGRGARSFFNWHEKPPMIIHGPGGMGKSALIARFILNHLEPGTDVLDELPFVYLDFDRASLAPDRPITLLLEAGKQLTSQFPKLTDAWLKIQPRWTAELQQPVLSPDLMDRIPLDLLGLLESGHLLERPLLVVLDTFEEVQYRSRDFVKEVFRFLALFQRTIPRLRTVVVGRATVVLDDIPTDNHALGPLISSDAEYYLRERGLTPRLAELVVAQVGGNPLSLRLALEVINTEGAGRRGIEGLETRNGIYLRLQDSQIQGQLYRRILGHIHNGDVAKLAHPGLVLRRITPELILNVLAKPCGADVPDMDTAQSLFAEMQREVSLVAVAEDGSLRHLPEVRRVMIDLLRQDDPMKVPEIQKHAIAYYADQPGKSASAERLYHMLALGRPRNELETVWATGGLEQYLSDVLESELPPMSWAWLAPRIGREIEKSSVSQAELPEWELYTVQRASDFLRMGKFAAAVDLLRGRTDRTYASPVYVVQAQALILTEDLAGARETIATGLREVQDPVSILKFTVMGSWIDNLSGEGPDEKKVATEIMQLDRRFKGDPRVIRFGLHRLKQIPDVWVRGRIQEQLAEIAVHIPHNRLSSYRLLARDLAEQVGVNVPSLVVQLAQVFGLQVLTATKSEAAHELVEQIQNWDSKTGALKKYRVNTPELFVRNLTLLHNRVGLPDELLSAMAALFVETIPSSTPQSLYEEMETDSRGPVRRPPKLK
jgi:hypothetical protein